MYSFKLRQKFLYTSLPEINSRSTLYFRFLINEQKNHIPLFNELVTNNVTCSTIEYEKQIKSKKVKVIGRPFLFSKIVMLRASASKKAFQG